jgi:uncharacterized cupredoxin-like copper-binding protein
MPAEITGGQVTLRLVNDGPGYHHVEFVRLADGKTVDDLKAALSQPGPFPSWATPAGGPNVVDMGHDLVETMDLPPGNYAVLCFVDLPDHVPHFTKGMIRPLKVLPPAAGVTPAVLPPPDLKVSLTEYSFTLSDSVTAGMHTVDVVSTGVEPHELAIFRLYPGVTMDQFMKWGATYEGPVPASVVGGVTPVMAGVAQRITVDFQPGDYVLLCFVPGADGKPHMMKGMMKTFSVKA